MSNTKIHIDQLFAKGLENLEIPVYSSDFTNISKDVASDSSSLEHNNSFENFELPVTDSDWLAIKAKLAIAIASDPFNNVGAAFSDFELEVTDNDWQVVKDKLAKSPTRTMPILPTEYVKQSLADFEIALTDADWQATKSKLNNANKKKMVWWWWLNIAIIGSLIGFGLNQLAPLNPKVAATENTITKLKSEIVIIEPKTQNTIPTEAYKPNPAKKESSIAETSNNTNAGVTSKHKAIYKHIAKVEEKENAPQTIAKNNNPQIIAKNNSSTDLLKTEGTTTPFKDPSLPAASLVETIGKTKNTEKPTNKPEVVENKVPAKGTIVLNDFKETNPPQNANKVEPDVKDNTPTSNAETVFNNTATVALDTTKKTKPANTPTVPPIIPPLSPLTFYAGIVTEVAITGRKLTSDNQAYTTIRNNADKAGTQFSFGFAAGMQKGKNQFQSGFQVTQQSVTSNYNYVIQIEDSLALYKQGGTILVGKFPIGHRRDTTIEESTHTTIKKVEIPFTYNRFWKLDAKTQLITGFGGAMSINVKNEGTKMLNPANNQLYNYSYLKGAEQKMGFSPNLNLGIQRQIGTNLMLQTNVFGKYSVTNRYDETFTAKQYAYSRNASAFSAKEYVYSYGLSIKLLYLFH